MPGNGSTNINNMSVYSELAGNLNDQLDQNKIKSYSSEITDEMSGPCIEQWLSVIRMDEKKHTIFGMYEQLTKAYHTSMQEIQRLTEANRELEISNQELEIANMMYEEDQEMDDLKHISRFIHAGSESRDEDSCISSQQQDDIDALYSENYNLSLEVQRLEHLLKEHEENRLILTKVNSDLSSEIGTLESKYQELYQQYEALVQRNGHLFSTVLMLQHAKIENDQTVALLENIVRELCSEINILTQCHQEDAVDNMMVLQVNEGLFAIILQQQQELEALKEASKKYQGTESGLPRANVPGFFGSNPNAGLF